MKRILILVCFLNSACALTVEKSDFKRGIASEEQFKRNYFYCKMESKKYSANVGMKGELIGGENYVEFMKDCMRSKGHEAIERELEDL